MLPLAAVIGLTLALSGWWRGLAAWLVAVVGVLGTIAVLKAIFFACSRVLGASGIISPSGHTAASAVILGGALVLFLRGRVPAAVIAVLPVSIAVLFGITRLAVHAHTVPEVLLGGAVGLAGVVVLAMFAGRRPAGPGWLPALGAIAVLGGLHGLRLNAETALHGAGLLAWLPLPGACRGGA